MYLFLVVIFFFLNINVLVFINFDVASDNSCSEAQLRSQLVAALPLGSVDNLIYYYSGSNLSRNRIKTKFDIRMKQKSATLQFIAIFFLLDISEHSLHADYRSKQLTLQRAGSTAHANSI